MKYALLILTFAFTLSTTSFAEDCADKKNDDASKAKCEAPEATPETSGTTVVISGAEKVVDGYGRDTENKATDKSLGSLQDVKATGTLLGEGTMRGGIRFDVSAIPANAVIKKAELKLFVTQNHKLGKEIVEIRLAGLMFETRESWVSVYGNDMFLDGEVVAKTEKGIAKNAFITLDVKSAVEKWVKKEVENNGLAFSIPAEETSKAQFAFASTEVKIEANRPALSITYSVPATE